MRLLLLNLALTAAFASAQLLVETLCGNLPVHGWQRSTSRREPRPEWQGLDVVFYGDSIVESWRGTELGVSVERAKGIPDMWGRHFGEPYHAKAFGIASA